MKVSGEKIRQLRIGRGLTVQQLAERINVTRQALEHWERNGVPTLKTLTKLAKGLEMAPEFLLEK